MENVFLFKFSHSNDIKWIRNGGTWLTMGYHLVLRKCQADVVVEDLDFSRSRFWVRVLGVPLMMRTKGNCERIGELLRVSVGS